MPALLHRLLRGPLPPPTAVSRGPLPPLDPLCRIYSYPFDVDTPDMPGVWQATGGNPLGCKRVAPTDNYSVTYPTVPGRTWQACADTQGLAGFHEVRMQYLQGAAVLQTVTSGGGRSDVGVYNRWCTDLPAAAPAFTDGVRFYLNCTGDALVDNVVLQCLG